MNDEPRSDLGQQQEPTVPTGPASLPEPVPASGPRRPSRRRWLLVACVVLVGVSLVVGAGVLLVSRQPLSVGRVTSTTTATSAGGTATSPAGSAEADSKDFGRVPRGEGLVDRFDASVFLLNTIDAAQQGLIRRRVAALPFVEQFAYQSQVEAFEKFRDQFRNQPQMLRGVTPRVLPASFRVVLRDPRQFPALYGRLCSGRWSFSTEPVCKPGVRIVIANPRSVYYGLER